jgi:hypothetical protein
MSGILQGFLASIGSVPPFGEAIYSVPGTYSWTAPAGVTSVRVVCVGAGGGSAASTSGASGAGGGGLGWKNNILVTPGNSYTVVVGAGGTRATSGTAPAGGESYFINNTTVAGKGGGGGIVAGDGNPAGGTYVGDGGGDGGVGGSRQASVTSAGGGGGAGGYSGNGGAGAQALATAGTLAASGSGGGGGGGGRCGASDTAGAGGGVGIYGEGSSGSGGANSSADGASGFGGSSGFDGLLASTSAPADVYSSSNPSRPGAFGGGGSGSDNSGLVEQTAGGSGAVRIIWGPNRSFPSTNVGLAGLNIGDAFEGGYLGGVISTAGNGIADYYLIVAPLSSGQTTNIRYKTTATTTPTISRSFIDGPTNTAELIALSSTDYPAASFCDGLAIGGFSDWYMPARNELGVLYYNLKPSTESNAANRGANTNYVPPVGNYAGTIPSQTAATDFITGGSQAFDTALTYWASTHGQDAASLQAFFYGFFDGATTDSDVNNLFAVRAVRRVPISS